MVLSESTLKVIQKLDLDGSSLLAPEIPKGLPHDSSADIWALGQVAYLIMSVPRSKPRPLVNIYAEDAQWLDDVPDSYKELVAEMIRRSPASRPTAS